ncbi:HDR194Wp [Eremothecium sinecaudum]|uniref:HDR194Wp n=1 Tax=Eremothecium sinecaudum TaxID=45286 RepID=A0A0X8HSB2_9SACH|nr:HDR194Wp [Eremothecium sinecaudum]AMD20936.1 HDR194Wp [Eremothecium sinecaudum]
MGLTDSEGTASRLMSAGYSVMSVDVIDNVVGSTEGLFGRTLGRLSSAAQTDPSDSNYLITMSDGKDLVVALNLLPTKLETFVDTIASSASNPGSAFLLEPAEDVLAKRDCGNDCKVIEGQVIQWVGVTAHVVDRDRTAEYLRLSEADRMHLARPAMAAIIDGNRDKVCYHAFKDPRNQDKVECSYMHENMAFIAEVYVNQFGGLDGDCWDACSPEDEQIIVPEL